MNSFSLCCNLFLCFCLLMTVSACKTVPDEYGYGDPVKPLSVEERMLISARNAALEKQYKNIEKGSLAKAEKAYRLNPKNVSAAITYVGLLRQVNMLAEADLILKPFTVSQKKPNEAILIEYSKIKLAQGAFGDAQMYIQEVVLENNKNPEAQMILGIAVDAQGHHQAAENHYRKALDHVSIDLDLQKAIRNNLALSLMAQKKNEEALAILNSIDPVSAVFGQQTLEANRKLADKL